MSNIEIFQTKDGESRVEVTFEENSVWLTLNQISILFNRNKSVISRHLKNIFKENELTHASTVAKKATVQKEGNREVVRDIEFYNLDAILSVGYRVNSKEGTRFRIWATDKLKDYLVKGYVLNKKRLEELRQIVEIIQNSSLHTLSEESEAQGLLDILSNYTKSFALLNQFDSNSLTLNSLNENITYQIGYPEAINAINKLRNKLMDKNEASHIFGNQKDKSFEGILNTVTQTFDGYYLYPTIEEQASHLLYFIIKNHPFSDGNKRIGAFMFIWFLDKNKHLLKSNGEIKINDNALTALALLTAQSDPSDKDLIIKLICNLIN
ncbi:virulence protein RhuM/Fic/DOC family protein [Elizabethkingia meningoseptica]|uniref:virulence protein RhuM/Fic/DOC family protein n=1 Tax=Elizabethkingia meningoseptica TaxID=238 RepID=UPI00301A3252